MDQDQVVVDIPALAAQLLVSSPGSGSLSELRAAIMPQEPAGNACQFGHANQEGARFCSTCGLTVGVEVMDMEAALAPPKPAELLTPGERAEREAEHQRSVAANNAFAAAEPESFQPTEGTERVTVHFVDDGLTALGQVWRRGQEISIGPDHPRWEDARRWIMLSPGEQVARYGKQFFAAGHVPHQESAEQQALQVEVRRQTGLHQQHALRNASGVPDGELLEKR